VFGWLVEEDTQLQTKHLNNTTLLIYMLWVSGFGKAAGPTHPGIYIWFNRFHGPVRGGELFSVDSLVLLGWVGALDAVRPGGGPRGIEDAPAHKLPYCIETYGVEVMKGLGWVEECLWGWGAWIVI